VGLLERTACGPPGSTGWVFSLVGAMNLLAAVRDLFEPTLARLVPDPKDIADYQAMVKPAADPRNGDYQANFAMRLGKVLGRKPQDVAEEIVTYLGPNELVESATVAGPGFINLKLTDDALTSRLREMAADARLGVAPAAAPRKYVIDYSSPNVAKPLHVGHLRSTIIGDALTRLLRFLGHPVVTDNHLGDWGTQFGMLIYGYTHVLDKAAYEADPVRELARLYVRVREEIKKAGGGDDEEEAANPVAEACRLETARLHAGNPASVALWNQFMPHCLEAIRQIYRRLGVLPFDFEHGESFYNPMLAAVVDEMLANGMAFESKGAVVIPNAKGNIPQTEEELKKEEPPAILRKRDGAFTYTTSDLATVKYRVEHFHPDAMLYVVDFRQALHFKTFFAQARRWGYDRVELTHISFGSVLGEDKKPFAARKGGAPELTDLIDEAVRLGLQKYEESYADRKAHGHDVPELTDEVKRDIAEAIGVGAMKYADLSGNRTSDYVFSYDKMLATEGNTGTYMQYAYARCRAIPRKGRVDEARFRADPPAVRITHPAERVLSLALLRFEETLAAAADEYLPHLIAAYLWDVAKAFSVFYESCKVLDDSIPPELRDSRLLLVDLTGRVIRQALDLLGIRTVERM
jgi:arginyl-tRNA synthetase